MMNVVKVRKTVDREKKDLIKIKPLNKEGLYSDYRLPGKVIRKKRGRSSSLKTLIKTVDDESKILARIRVSSSQPVSKVGNVKCKTISTDSSALNDELSHTQNLLIRSARILDITTQNINAADSTLHEKNFAEKIATLVQNQLHASTHTNKKE
jgi:hypothetical protein